MKLNISDRLVLLQILPDQGNRLTLRMVNELAAKIGLTEQELKEFVVQHADGRVVVTPAGLAFEIEIELSEFFLKHYKETFAMMEAKSTMPRGFLFTAEKFIGSAEPLKEPPK